MTVANPNFALPGATSSEAAGWTRTLAAAGLFAPFTPADGAVEAVETFRWWALTVDGTFMLMQWDTRAGAGKPVEDFEDLWGARHARLLSGREAPFVLQPGMTLLVSVNGSAAVTVTFQDRDFANIADARAEEVARVIDRALAGADAVMAPGGKRVAISTTAQGYNTTLEVTGGTAASLFAFPAVARGADEEGGSFFRRAEFDLMNDAGTNAEVEAFKGGWVDGAVVGKPYVLDLRYDPFDKLARLTLPAAEPFLPAAWIGALNTYTFAPTEVFEQSAYPGETLTINF